MKNSTKPSFLKMAIIIILALFFIINLAIILMGKGFVYKALYYNFADIDDYKIFNNRVINKSTDPQPWLLSPDYNVKKLPSELIETMKNLKTVAFLVVKDGSIVHEEYWDGYNENSLSNSFSMAKSYVSALAGAAIKDGAIKSIEDAVGDYLPEFNEGEKKKIKVRHLLTMSSGLDWDEGYASLFSITTEAYYGNNLRKLVDKLKPQDEPGVYFEYKSGDTQILSFVIEKATGKHLADYASEKLWQPMGAVNDALWCLDKKEGDEKAYCCVNSNARDFARFGYLYLNHGNWKGNQLLDSAYVTASITPNELKDKENEKIVDYYGFSWWLIPGYKGQNIAYCRGILGQYIIVIPEKNIVIVRLGKVRGKKDDNEPHFPETYQMIDAVNAMF